MVEEKDMTKEIENLQEELDAKWRLRMNDYEAKVAELKKQKEQYIRDNPNCSLADILFLNVLAPPQRIEIKIVV